MTEDSPFVQRLLEIVARADEALPVTTGALRDSAQRFARIPPDRLGDILVAPTLMLAALDSERYGTLFAELNELLQNRLLVDWALYLLMYGYAAALTNAERHRTMAA